MLGIVVLKAIKVSVVMLNVVMLSNFMHTRVVMLNVYMVLSFGMLCAVARNVLMLIIVMESQIGMWLY
jgi:hypothetical protein